MKKKIDRQKGDRQKGDRQKGDRQKESYINRMKDRKKEKVVFNHLQISTTYTI